MKPRLIRCPGCQTSFLAGDDTVACPKCGAAVARPAASPRAVDPEPDPVVFVPATGGRRGRRAVKVGLFVLTALIVATAIVVVAWPKLRPSPPADPIEATATAYLRAMSKNDAEALARLGTVELPPAIRSFRDVRHVKEADTRLRGSFAPIAALNRSIDERFVVDPASGRYTPRDTLGPAADVLDALHAAKAQAESSDLYKKMQSGDPNDIFDAAEGLGKTFTNLAEGVLAPKKLVPTYKQLLDDAKPPLPAASRSLALDVGENRTTWDLLLKRPFATLKADGPFILERAEVTASAADALASSGDPPTTIHLTMTRFRLEGIDTGWRVTSARRGADPEPSPSEK